MTKESTPASGLIKRISALVRNPELGRRVEALIAEFSNRARMPKPIGDEQAILEQFEGARKHMQCVIDSIKQHPRVVAFDKATGAKEHCGLAAEMEFNLNCIVADVEEIFSQSSEAG